MNIEEDGDEFGREEAQEKNAQAQASEDAQEDTVATEAQGLASDSVGPSSVIRPSMAPKRFGAITVPRFNETALSLFPAIRGDPEEALALSEAMMMLHRRMERAVARAKSSPAVGADDAAPEPRRRWPFQR